MRILKTVLPVVFLACISQSALGGPHRVETGPAFKQLLGIAPRTPCDSKTQEAPSILRRPANCPTVCAGEEKKVIIMDGVIDLKPLRGNAIPPGAEEEDIKWEGWVKYFIKFEQKGSDATLAGAQIKLMFFYGGKYQGKGKYIGDIQVRAVKSFPLLTVIAELPGTSVHNCGTMDEPVACIDLVLTFNVKPRFLANESRAYKYVLCGNGTIVNPSGVRLEPGATDNIIQKPQ